MKRRSLIEGAALGPLVTLGTVVAIGFVARVGLRVPEASVISLAAVIFAALQGGFAAGLISSAIALVPVLADFLAPGRLLGGHPLDLPRVVTWSVATPATAILASVMRQRLLRQSARLEAANAELQTLAATDPLTGLKNRRALMEGLEYEIARGSRTRRPLSIIMMDVDHFKPFNDTFGHAAGDDILRVVAAVLRRSLRATDFAARLGGDEFVIVLSDTNQDGALVVAERVRQAIERAPWPRRSITASFGVATFDPARGQVNEPYSPSTLIASADRALYHAKRDHRDRVIHADVSMKTAPGFEPEGVT